MQIQFTNPYEGCRITDNESTGTRLQSIVKAEDYQFIQGLRLRTGTMTTTVNLLMSKLVQALKQRGILDVTKRDEFEAFVANCQLVVDGEQNKRKKKI